MRIKDIIKTIEDVAPLAIQEGFDNSGVQIGNINNETSGALVCLDITEDVVDEAISLNCNLIISHHPLIFSGLKSITGKNYIERILIKAIKHDICIYSAHTNLDSARFGVNYMIAKKIGLKNISTLSPVKNMLLKLVTYVPVEHCNKVMDAMFEAGAGNIGDYSNCSFSSDGNGSFMAGENSNPYCGNKGELHIEEERRLEVILPSFIKNKVIAALMAAHPYEEPAFDIIPLANQWNNVGLGVIGELNNEVSLDDFANNIKQIFACETVMTGGSINRKIKKIALCGDCGSSFIKDALYGGADLFLTGEIKYHDFFDFENKMILMSIGHYESEKFTQQLLKEIINNKYETFVVNITKVNTNPIKYL